jgi:hypothetical protein
VLRQYQLRKIDEVSGNGDRRVLKLIRKWLKAGVMEDGHFHHMENGTHRAESSRSFNEHLPPCFLQAKNIFL